MILKIFAILLFIYVTANNAETTIPVAGDCNLWFLQQINLNILSKPAVDAWTNSLKVCVAEIRNSPIESFLRYQTCDEVTCSTVCAAASSNLVRLILDF